MYGCEVCGGTIYDPDEDRLCSECVNRAIQEYIKRYKEELAMKEMEESRRSRK